jgi:NADH-dependent peroxiredoxin subunit F
MIREITSQYISKFSSPSAAPIARRWFGFPLIGGRELAELMRNRIEIYPVAERCHATAREVRRTKAGFEVETEDGASYRSKAVIYDAGKQYRRLGVPGEDRFLGHGIAFRDICDAPLYREKRVAMVGGGNSAFTVTRRASRA